MTSVARIELKLQNGVQQFSAQEIASLLNLIRIQQQLLDKRESK